MAGMQLDLEAIVREVMRRLERELPADAPAVPPAAAAPPNRTEERPVVKPARPSARSKPGTLQVQDRVVTWAQLRDRVSGVRQLVVPAGAVVTPSVRDELRKRQIELQFARAVASGATEGGANLLVAAAAGEYDTDAVLETIGAEAGGIERVGSGGLVDLVRQLCDRVARVGLPAVLLTGEPAAAACLANRFAPLRAVWGAGVGAVQQGCQSIGANVLVLDPAAHNEHELGSMVRQFLEGSHQCPPNWQTVLAGATKP